MIRQTTMWGVSVLLLGHFNLGCTEKENLGTAAHVDSATPSAVEPTTVATDEVPSPIEPESSAATDASHTGSGGRTAETNVDSSGLETGGAGASSETTMPPAASVDAGPPEPRCCVSGVVYPDCEDPAIVMEKLCERYVGLGGSYLVYHREGNCSYFATRTGSGGINGALLYWTANEFIGCWGGVERSGWSWTPPDAESKFAECGAVQQESSRCEIFPEECTSSPPCVLCGTGSLDLFLYGEQVCTPEEAYPFTPRLAPDFTPLPAPDGGVLPSADASVE